MTQGKQSIIQPAEKTYGYLVGLSLERGDLSYSKEYPGRMFARFESGVETATYLVPDWELFDLLARCLCDSAQARAQSGNYTYAKLVIRRDKGGWHVSAVEG